VQVGRARRRSEPEKKDPGLDETAFAVSIEAVDRRQWAHQVTWCCIQELLHKDGGMARGSLRRGKRSWWMRKRGDHFGAMPDQG
jgi:hypothetical protein